MHSSTATLHGAQTNTRDPGLLLVAERRLKQKEKGWLQRDARYFHDNVRWNWFKELVPRLIGWITGHQVDKAIAEVT